MKKRNTTSIALRPSELLKFKQIKQNVGCSNEKTLDMILFLIRLNDIKVLEKKQKKKIFVIDIKPETKKALNKIAKSKNMSVSLLIETFLINFETESRRNNNENN